jgi:hypothetical protein
MNPTQTQSAPVSLRWPLANPVTGQPRNPFINTNDFCDWLSQRNDGTGGLWFSEATHIENSQPRPDLN